MKVIFLDFDGVLNSNKYPTGVEGIGDVILEPAKMVLLKRIVEATGAKIVLSTSWRLHWSKIPEERSFIGKQIEEIFASYGLEIMDKTPYVGRKRETQIKCFLDSHPEVDSFVVLDDMLLYAEYLEGHIIKTSGYFGGLDETDAMKVIEILGAV